MPSSYTLGAHYEDFIRKLVESGRYVTASEVIRDALRLLETEQAEREAKLAELRRLIQEGLDSGPAEPWDIKAFLEEQHRRKDAAEALKAAE